MPICTHIQLPAHSLTLQNSQTPPFPRAQQLWALGSIPSTHSCWSGHLSMGNMTVWYWVGWGSWCLVASE